jgi:predicted dehydrogenase
MKLSIGVLGGRHDYVPVVLAHMKRNGLYESAEIVAFAEEDEVQRRRMEGWMPGAKAYTSIDELLDTEKLDVGVIGTSLADHVGVVGKCIDRGIHTILDKPMAMTVTEADRLLDAARSRGVHMMVDIPTAWNPGIRKAKELVDSGVLGDVFYAKYRSANMGPDEIGCDPLFYDWLFDPKRGGAGVIFDYVDYGALFSIWFFGRPSSVVASGGTLAKQGVAGPDNVTAILEYPKRIVLAEGSWTQIGAIPIDGPIILGTRGTVVVDYAVQHGEYGPESWQWNLKGVRMYLKGYSEWINIDLAPNPTGMRSGIDHLIHAIISDQSTLDLPVRPDTHADVQRVLDASVRALDTGQRTHLEWGE